MNKEEGNFWTGLLLGKLLGNKKADGTKKGGCLSSIIGLFIIIFAFIIGYAYGIKTLIAIAIVIFLVIPIIIGILKGNKRHNLQVTSEAWDLYNNGNYTLALEKAEEMATKDSNAADLAGLLYLNGDGCDANAEKAFKYFEMGKKGNIEAKAYYATMLITGNGCTQNIELGKKELINAAIVGNGYAKMRLGEYQITGDYGFNKDIEQGMKNLRIAMDEGYVYAEYLVGMMQFNGFDGVTINKEKGYELLQDAANRGSSEAADFLNKINSQQ